MSFRESWQSLICLIIPCFKKKKRFTLPKKFPLPKTYVSSQKSPDSLWGQPSLIQWVPGPFRGGKAAGKWSDHLPPSSVKIKNEWSCTSTPHIYLHGSYREKFALYPLPERVIKQRSSGQSKHPVSLWHTSIIFSYVYLSSGVSTVSFLCICTVLFYWCLGAGFIIGTCAVKHAG